MRLIYDLHEVMLLLEHDVITRALDVSNMVRNRHTVEGLKTLWVREKLWKLHGLPLADDARFQFCAQTLGAMKNFSRDLEQPLYRIVRLPSHPSIYQRQWLVELRYNVLYLLSD
jgi:hypothetical protein